MKTRKNVASMTSEELYELARKKEKEEREKERERVAGEIARLQEEKARVRREYRKKVSEIDRKIRALGKKAGATAKTRKRAGKTGTTRGAVSATVLGLFDKSGKKVTTAEIRGALDAAGLETGNLPQLLSYLKRRGRIKSTARGVYVRG